MLKYIMKKLTLISFGLFVTSVFLWYFQNIELIVSERDFKFIYSILFYMLYVILGLCSGIRFEKITIE